MAIEFRLPELGEQIKSGTIVKILVSVGDLVKHDQPVLEMETEKAVMEVPSPVEGKVTKIHVKEGEKAEIGQLILTIEGGGTSAPTSPPKAAVPAPTPAPQPSRAEAPALPVQLQRPKGSPVAAAPSVRQFAREIGIDVSQVPGSGADGRISIEDVKKFAKALNEGRAQTSAVGGTLPAVRLPDFTKWGEVERQPMNNVRRKTAEHLALAWSTIPHVTQFDWANITEVEELRKQFMPKAEKAGAKVTLTAILIKVVASALNVFPKFNASIDPARGEIILKKYCNIGVAVDTERGLLVPVIRNVDAKNILQIAVEMARLAEKARSGKIALEDLQGGTFTITNLGGIGGTHFTPIINFPEVAILGAGRAVTQTVFTEGVYDPGLMLPLSLSYDHRLIDGADGVRFTRWIAEALEKPMLLPLEG